jgi:hypothetical protein
MVVADMIRGITGGNLFQIDTVENYPADYNEYIALALDEKNGHAKIFRGLSVWLCRFRPRAVPSIGWSQFLMKNNTN